MVKQPAARLPTRQVISYGYRIERNIERLLPSIPWHPRVFKLSTPLNVKIEQLREKICKKIVDKKLSDKNDPKTTAPPSGRITQFLSGLSPTRNYGPKSFVTERKLRRKYHIYGIVSFRSISTTSGYTMCTSSCEFLSYTASKSTEAGIYDRGSTTDRRPRLMVQHTIFRRPRRLGRWSACLSRSTSWVQVSPSACPYGLFLA